MIVRKCLFQPAPLPSSLLEDSHSHHTSMRDLHSMSVDPEACSTPISKHAPMMLLPDEVRRFTSSLVLICPVSTVSFEFQGYLLVF